MELNRKAWDLLSQDEKTAASLQLGMDKSSWESGEIMGKSHYKFLEIKYRAEQYIRMFTEHLESYHEIFPKFITGDKVVIRYFQLCVEFRKKPMRAQEMINKEFGRVPKLLLNERIIKTLKIWDKEDNVYNKSILHLVKEFDRWNNFRILPKEIQEPSAFKRRIKNSYKKQVKATKNLHPLALEKIKKTYLTKNSPSIYLPLLTPLPDILRIKVTKGSMEVVNTLGLYVFKDKAIATEYIASVYHYTSKAKRECTDGLDFWPKYRDITKKAHNYNEVMKIIPSRKYLQLAMQKLNFI